LGHGLGMTLLERCGGREGGEAPGVVGADLGVGGMAERSMPLLGSWNGIVYASRGREKAVLQSGL
jgi:hypothetical protein